MVGLGWILGVNNVDTREISPVLAREGVEVGLVSSRGTDEGRFDEVLKDWARLRKLAKMGCVKGLRSVSDGKLLGMALLALVIDTGILLFLRSNEWKKKKSRKCGIYFF